MLDVISANYLKDYQLELGFEDGKAGVVDFYGFIQRGGVFAKLADLDFFKKFSINPDLGTIVWGDEIDIAPETLYSLATQTPLPDWMSATRNIPEPA